LASETRKQESDGRRNEREDRSKSRCAYVVRLHRRCDACRRHLQLPEFERWCQCQTPGLGRVGNEEQSILRRPVFRSARNDPSGRADYRPVPCRTRDPNEAETIRTGNPVSDSASSPEAARDRAGASFLQRLWRRPQGVWARRALFQIHLWSGIAIGLYLILISLTGSLLVFRIELHKMFERPPLTVAVKGERLNDDQLKAAAKGLFPDHTVTNVWPAKKQEDPVEIWLSRDDTGRAIHRLFNPYTGENLGPPEPA